MTGYILLVIVLVAVVALTIGVAWTGGAFIVWLVGGLR